MTNNKSSMTHAAFFNSVLTQIELGKVEQGINLLSGMLDAACMQGASLIEAFAHLKQNMLHQVLLMEPGYRYAANHKGDSVGLYAAIASAENIKDLGATGQRLCSVIATLPIVRALQQRQSRYEQLTLRAWQAGSRICLLEFPLSETFAGRDVSNITSMDMLDIKHSQFINKSFDLICAPSLADTYDDAALTAALLHLKTMLAPNGRIIISSVLPLHLGTGWRLTCLNWDANTHSDEALLCCAAQSGFIANICRDESGCTAWCELRIASKH